MPLRNGCSRQTESANFRKLYAENQRLPPSKRRSRDQIVAIVLAQARRTGAGRKCQPKPNPNQRAGGLFGHKAAQRASGRMRPTPAAIGKRYAQDQLSSDHFADWMLDQLHATGPGLIDDPTRDNARRIARNMLMDLRYETTRNLTDRDVQRQLSEAGARDDTAAVREWGRGFHGGLDASVDGLADEVLLRLKEKRAARRRRK